MTKLIYIADPMCSWCYGFGPELTSLLEGLPDMPLELIVGGLRAYNTEVMDDALKSTLLSHWEKVSKASGLSFTAEALTKSDFIYDTEPACRAVVATGLLAPQAALDVFHAIQHGFYAEGKDTTLGKVLAEIAVATLRDNQTDIDEKIFLATWDTDEARRVTKEDFAQTQRWGVQGFPTLVLEHDGALHLVTSGFVKADVLVQRMQEIVDRVA